MKLSSLALKKFSKFPKEVKNFFFDLDAQLKISGHKLILTSGKLVNLSGGRCSGYFDDFNKELKVALGKGWRHAFCCAIHESSHHSQAQDESSVWHDEGINQGHSDFFSWLQGEEFDDPEQLCRAAMKLELDCEQRSYQKIKRFRHLVSPIFYARRANSYIASYVWILENRSWLKKSPYKRSITKFAPEKIVKTIDDFPEELLVAQKKFL